jgi:GMP synthase (glutamine-hydrolysing)
MHNAIAVLDFGSQYSQLIARRVREAQVYCELFPWDAPSDLVLALLPCHPLRRSCLIYAPGAPQIPPYVLESGRPILGICYGMQASRMPWVEK